MEFKVSQKELKDALTWIQDVVEKKTTKAILTNVLFETNSSNIVLSGTDLEVGIKLEVPAQVQSQGKLALPAKSLYDIVREIKGDEIKFHQKDKQWLEIKSGASKFKVAGLPAQEFPTMPELPSKADIYLDAPQLNSMIEKTLFAVSTDEAKYNLNGIYLEIRGEDLLRMVATDGHRLSYCERKMTQKVNLKQPVLLPRKGVLELKKMITAEDGIIPIFLEGRNLVVQKEGLTLFIRLIEGDFPDYQQVMPKETKLERALVSKDHFIGALRRVSLLSQENNRGVKLIFSAGNLELLCKNPDLGEAREEIECDYKGKHFEIGFNYRYFLDVLSVLEDEQVILDFKDDVSPCLIKSQIDNQFISLVMPMRL